MIKRAFVLLCISVLMFFAFAGCGENNNSEILGKWTPATVSLNGESMQYSELGMDSEQFKLEFEGNGNCNATLAGVSGSGSYTFNGTSVDIELRNEPQKLDYDNGTLTLVFNYDNTTAIFVFTKVTENE